MYMYFIVRRIELFTKQRQEKCYFLSRVSLVILALKRASISQMQFLNQEKKFIQLLKRYVRDKTSSAFVKEVLLARHKVVLVFSYFIDPITKGRNQAFKQGNGNFHVESSSTNQSRKSELIGCGNVPQKQTFKNHLVWNLVIGRFNLLN